MKHISILIPQGHTSVVNIEGCHQIFNEVNTVRAEMGKPALFNVQLVGLANETSQRNGLFTINPDVLIDEVIKTDLIIIPAIYGSPDEIMSQNQAFVPWIIDHYKRGTEVVSLCIGSFFLASTGLQMNKHRRWYKCHLLRSLFYHPRGLHQETLP